MKHYIYAQSTLGRVLLTSDGCSLTGVYFVGQKYAPIPAGEPANDPGRVPFAQARAELAQYFAGERQQFGVPLAPEGTPFQQHVWRALAAIPYGTTVSYAELARSLGAPRSVRAVAAAIARNPIAILIPCHRVIGSNGSLRGYAGGLERKRALLGLEACAETAPAGNASSRLPGAASSVLTIKFAA